MGCFCHGASSFTGFETGLTSREIKGGYFDTEQSHRHCLRQYQRITELLGRKPGSELQYYMLRCYSPEERLEMVKQAIYSSRNWSFVVIDGIADLLSKGVNDEEGAIRVTNLLMKWSFEKNVHIVTVLHQNKGDSNAKGHIGSQLVQKSETVLSVEKDFSQREISKVSSPFARGMEIEDFYFALDDDGIPFIVENSKPEGSATKSKNPFSYDQAVTYGIIRQVFSKHEELSYSALIDNIRSILAKHSIDIGDRKCRAWITYFIEEGMIVQEKKNKPYKLNNEWQGGVAWHP